jgi:hypothetical protein
MSLAETVMEGTVQSDGTLVLDEPTKMPAGRVTVILREQPQPRQQTEDWLQHLQRMRADREAAGYPFMDQEESTSYIECLREGNRIDDLLRDADLQRQSSGQS